MGAIRIAPISVEAKEDWLRWLEVVETTEQNIYSTSENNWLLALDIERSQNKYKTEQIKEVSKVHLYHLSNWKKKDVIIGGIWSQSLKEDMV